MKPKVISLRHHRLGILQWGYLVNKVTLGVVVINPRFLGNATDHTTAPSAAYPAEEGDSATDTDTPSSVGDTNYDFSDIAHLSHEDQQQELLWAYEHHKG